MKHFFYRASTLWSSFKALYTLPKEKVDAFVNAFDIFAHDWRDEEKLKQTYGENYYETVQKKIQDYYSVLNLVCSLSSVEKMYIPPMLDPKKSLFENQELFERRMMNDLQLKSANKVLDIGCGRGRIAAHVARVSKAHVSGINIDDNQLSHAQKYATKTKMEKQLQFQKWDMNQLPFPFENNSLDAVYHVQAFSYSRDLYKLLKEIHRILKVGRRISSCDWTTLDNYNPTNPEHVFLVNQIKALLGAIGTPTKEEYLDAFRKAGFKIIKAEVPSGTSTDVLNIDKASKDFTFVHNLINFFVKVRILPRHFKTLLDQVGGHSVNAFMQVDKQQLATTNYHIVAEKI